MLKFFIATLACALILNASADNIGRKSNRLNLLSKAVGARMLSSTVPVDQTEDVNGQFVPITRTQQQPSMMVQQQPQTTTTQFNPSSLTPEQLLQIQQFIMQQRQQQQQVQTTTVRPVDQQLVDQQQLTQRLQDQLKAIQQQQVQKLQQQQVQQQQVQQQQIQQQQVQQQVQQQNLQQQQVQQQNLLQQLQQFEGARPQPNQIPAVEQPQRVQFQSVQGLLNTTVVRPSVQQVQQLPVQQVQQLPVQQVQQLPVQQVQQLPVQQVQQLPVQQQIQQLPGVQQVQQLPGVQQVQQLPKVQQVQQLPGVGVQQVQQLPVQQQMQQLPGVGVQQVQQVPKVQQMQQLQTVQQIQQFQQFPKVQQQITTPTQGGISDDMCVNAQPGDLIAHPVDPAQFIICYGFGEFTVMDCPEMLVFNPTLKRCDVNVEMPLLCKSNPCLNGGRCVEMSPVHFRCECTPGLGGEFCDKLDTCSTRPCGNDAVCIPFVLGSPVAHVCLCQGGRTVGTSCQQTEPNPCLRFGSNMRLMPLALNPSVFAQCEGNRPHIKFCSPPLVFSATKQECEWA